MNDFNLRDMKALITNLNSLLKNNGGKYCIIQSLSS